MNDDLPIYHCKPDSALPTKQASEVVPPAASSVPWGQMLRYKTDDRDISSSELCIMQGNNGDWYVAVADGPDHYPTNGVRICTSGGAAVACPGLGLAISKAYNAMFAAQNDKTVPTEGGEK